MKRIVFIDADWVGLNGPSRFASARIDLVRGREVQVLFVDPAWVRSQPAFFAERGILMVEGAQYPANNQTFGILQDSAPDRWGRLLMRRREVLQAREEGRPERTLLPTDFLLGVHDAARIGGLRFRTEPGGPWLDNRDSAAIPPLTALRSLETAARKLENLAVDEDDLPDELRLLLAPGSSLGGARPKASVSDPDGLLWIAKFPGQHDDQDVGAWEAVAHRLAAAAGLRTTENRLVKLSRHGHTFLIRRFDRSADGKYRIHFASAMCLLGASDGDGARTGLGYLDLADLITRISPTPETDLFELWCRVVFSILIRNTDDHLRNHAFLWTGSGWTLSPVYDINPNPDGHSLSLMITENDNMLEMEPALELAALLKIPTTKRDAFLTTCRGVMGKWREQARIVGLSKAACERMAACFKTP